jgi:hypothetical protein
MGTAAADAALGAGAGAGAGMGRETTPGEPVLRHAKPDLPRQPMATPQTSDEMDARDDDQLGPQWQWHANHGATWHDLHTRPGWLRLRALPLPARNGLTAAPNLLLQKLPAPAFTVETLVEPLAGVMAGLIVAGESAAALVVERAGGGQRVVVLRIDDRVAYAAPIAEGPVRLRVTMSEGGRCRFAFAVVGGAPEQVVATEFAARAGRWVGAQVGIFAAATPTGGAGTATSYADFDYVRFSGAAAAGAPR